ncbi:MAG: HxsD-like protein [Candidatus Omnitrophota bacterium]
MQKNIRFNTKIYKKEAIQETILAYAHLAKFRVKDSKDYIEVKIKNIDTGVKDIFVNEFNNYALGAAKKCL